MDENSINQHSLILLCAGLALITLPHAWHLPPQSVAFFAGLLIWRCAAIWRRGWLPNRWGVLLLTALGLLVLYSQHQGLFGRDAGTALFVVALGLKLFEIRSQRDVYLIVYLAFIVAASQFLYEQSIVMAGYIVLVCTLLLATLIIQQGSRTPLGLALKTTLLIIGQALPMAIVIFVLFPRLEAPRWMWLQDDHQARSGLSNTLEPGSISELSLSDELVFRVRFNGEPPPPRQRYWRGPVYSQTDGVRWSAQTPAAQLDAPPSVSGPAYSYTVLMEPQRQNWVFALDMPMQFDPALRRNAGYQLLSNKMPGNRAEYQITSYPDYNTGVLSPGDYQHNLRLPAPPSPRLLALLRQLQGDATTPQVLIDNILRYFSQESFYYTLTPPLMPEHPIETFLLDTRSGFCSHYATAFVYLLRAAHIPARVVGGYQGGAINPVGGFMEIRQADAHAWAEVWLENRGWVRFDPTAAVAPERIEQGVNIDLQIASGAVSFSSSGMDSEAINWLKHSRMLWQNVDYHWQRWVINYNTENQRHFLNDLGINDWADMAYWLIGTVSLLTLLVAAGLLKRGRGAADKTVRLYQQFCRKLAKAGVVIEKGEGALDFAKRAQSLRPELSVNIAQITALYIKLRYEPPKPGQDLQRLQQAVAQFKV